MQAHGEKEDSLRLLEQEIAVLKAERVAIREEVALQGAAITMSKDKLTSREKLLECISLDLDSSMVLSAQAAAQYKEVTNFTLDV